MFLLPKSCIHKKRSFYRFRIALSFQLSPVFKDESAPLYPPLEDVRRVSRKVALAVAKEAQRAGLAEKASMEELERRIDEKMWQPLRRPSANRRTRLQPICGSRARRSDPRCPRTRGSRRAATVAWRASVDWVRTTCGSGWLIVGGQP